MCIRDSLLGAPGHQAERSHSPRRAAPPHPGIHRRHLWHASRGAHVRGLLHRCATPLTFDQSGQSSR
eukprot:11384345-Alexandrium_andersonii.AAC.1